MLVLEITESRIKTLQVCPPATMKRENPYYYQNTPLICETEECSVHC
jgi:hypothetical protein